MTEAQLGTKNFEIPFKMELDRLNLTVNQINMNPCNIKCAIQLKRYNQ